MMKRALVVFVAVGLLAVALAVMPGADVIEAHGPFHNCIDWNACAFDECGALYNPCVVNGEYSWSCVALEACYDSCSDDFPGCVDIDLGDLP